MVNHANKTSHGPLTVKDYEPGLVSVIIPTYNRAHSLGRSIESVAEQSYKHFEIIIIDDGSIDDTKDIVESLNDERIIYIRHDRNKGGAAARNTGIKSARGEYIAFQDSDDEWLPGKMQKQVEILMRLPSKYAATYCSLWKIHGKKQTLISGIKVKKRQGYIHNQLLEGNFIDLPTIMIRKNCLDFAGHFDPKLPRFQDWELFLRLSKKYLIDFSEEPMLLSYYTPNSITATNDIAPCAIDYLLQKHFDEFSKDKRSLLKHYFFAFRTSLYCRNYGMARAMLSKLRQNCRFGLLGLPFMLLSLCFSHCLVRFSHFYAAKKR